MCGLCGVLGVEDHWSDTLDTTDQSDEVRIKRRREGIRRVEFANRILAFYGMKLTSWQNSSYVLSTLTGRQIVIDHLAALWPQVEALTGKSCDPLDEAFIGAMHDKAQKAHQHE